MNIWKAVAIGGVVYVGVKIAKDKGLLSGIPGLGSEVPSPAVTLPSPAGDEVGAPGGGGVVGGDPTVIPGQVAPEQASCNPFNAKSPCNQKPKEPIVRDHRTGGRPTATPTKPKPGPVITCVRAPCPVKPTSGGVSPHAQSVALRRILSRSPAVF